MKPAPNDEAISLSETAREPPAPTENAPPWLTGVGQFFRLLRGSARDITPIVLVVAFFQIVVLQRPFPNFGTTLLGLALVTVGLAAFLRGLEMALFPIGDTMAKGLASKGSLAWLLLFGFALGFGTTVAEPALIAIAGEAAEAATAAGVIGSTPEEQSGYANGLRYTVAASVGIAVVIGLFRILKGWPVHWIIIAGYLLVVALTTIAPAEIVGVAFDSGGVTTSTITVPLVTALGVGLASVIKGRSPLSDGFGLIAFASLTPMVFVLIYGMVV